MYFGFQTEQSKKSLKIPPFFKKLQDYSLGFVKNEKIDPSQNVYLNRPIERAWKELLNAYFGFENSCSKPKLWAVKEWPQNSPFLQKKRKAIALVLSKMGPSQNVYLTRPIERAYKELLNTYFGFENRCSKLKLWAIKEGFKIA